jgi:hypothetical protein
MMKGKGAPRSTIYGVLGRTVDDSYTRTLGGLVRNTSEGKLNPGTYMKASSATNTERHILGKSGKTRMPSAHYGQVPYPGKFIDKVGKAL